MIQHAIEKTYQDEAFWSTLTEKSTAQSGPFDGGCLICAKALIHAFGGGELVRIASELNGGQTEHYGARINGIIYDFDGPANTPTEWIARFVSQEQINDRTCSFDKGYDAETETPDDPVAVKAISRLLMKHSLN